MPRTATLQKSAPEFRRVLRHLWPYMRKERSLLAGSLLALFAEVGLRLLEPWPLKFVFDRVIAPTTASPSSGVAFLDALEPAALLTICAVGIVIITGLRALAAYFGTVGFAMVGNKVLAQLRAQLYDHLQRLSLSFHTKARGGDLVVRVTGDVSQLKEVAVTALLPLLANTLVLAGMLALMLWLNWQLTLLALSTIPLFWLSTVRLSGRIREAARTQRKREGAMAATAAESLGAIKVVQALSLEESLGQSFFSQNKESLKQEARASKLSASLERTVDVLIAIATGLVLWYGATLVMRSSMTPGDLLVFLAYLKNAFKPVKDFAKYTGRLAKATAAGERVLDLLEREPEVRDLPGALPAPRLKGAIRFENVSFEYEPGRPVLRKISLEVSAGERVALLGTSGHGKSTLAGLILRLYDPREGRVTIDGRDIRDYTLDSLRSQVSVVMQDTVLFAATVRDNIAYGSPDATDEEIEAATRMANAHEFIEALPDGYDTTLGERGVTLSNGQRQRIAIARAAIRRAPIVILDEPTTGLDQENERVVMEALERLTEGKTTLLITHRPSQIRFVDAVYLLQEGRLIPAGKAALAAGSASSYAILSDMQGATGGHRAEEKTGPSLAYAGNPADSVSLDAGLAAAVPAIPPAPQAETLGTRHSELSTQQRARVAWSAAAGLMVAGVFASLLLVGGNLARVNRGLAAPASQPASPWAVTPLAALSPTLQTIAQPTVVSQAVISRSSAQGKSVITFSGPLTGVVGLSWSPDNETLALASNDKTVRLLDTGTGLVVTLRGHTAEVFDVAWSPSGERLASASADGTVRIWSAGGQHLTTLRGENGLAPSVAWSPDGKTLVGISANVELFLWSSNGTSSRPLRESGTFTGLAWSPDGKTLALSSGDGTVRLWRADGTFLSTLQGHTDQVYTVAWSPDGKTVASGSNDKTVRIWSATGVPLATLVGHTEFVNSVTWSPDGTSLASAAGDKTARLWSATGAPLAVLEGHTSAVLGVEWSPDGKTIATCAADNTVRLWR